MVRTNRRTKTPGQRCAEPDRPGIADCCGRLVEAAPSNQDGHFGVGECSEMKGIASRIGKSRMTMHTTTKCFRRRAIIVALHLLYFLCIVQAWLQL